MQNEVWIGLVGIIPQEGNESLGVHAAGAYVNVLSLARDRNDYQQIIESEFGKRGFQVFDLEDVEPLQDRVQKYDVERSVIELGEEVTRTGRIQYGTYHTFPKEGAG